MEYKRALSGSGVDAVACLYVGVDIAPQLSLQTAASLQVPPHRRALGEYTVAMNLAGA